MQLRELTRNLSADDVPLPSMQSVLESSPSPTTPAPRTPLTILTNTTNIDDTARGLVASPVQEYTSPKAPFCDGFKCRQSSSMDEHHRHADIVSIVFLHIFQSPSNIASVPGLFIIV